MKYSRLAFLTVTHCMHILTMTFSASEVANILAIVTVNVS